MYNDNNDIEFASGAEIKCFQEQEMRKMLAYISSKSKFYKERFSSRGIDISEIRTLDDLRKLPFTTKQDLQLHNEEFLCVEQRDVIDFLSTSGTLGSPVLFALTENDLDRLALNECLSFSCAGVTPDDIVQLMCTMDKRFMCGLAWYLGLRKLGAGIIRVGSGVPEFQWDSISRMKPTVIACVPSFVKTLLQYAEANGIDYNSSSVKKIVCMGEAIRLADGSYSLLAQEILSKWNVELYSAYASTEMATSFVECGCHNGGHHHPELIICEVVDENLQPVEPGTYGELVITTLGVEAMPLLRFRTGDITVMYADKCGCGRNSFRLGPIVGRLNQMIKYKGTALYPPAVFDVLDNVPYVENYLVRLKSDGNGLDLLIVDVGLKSSASKNIDLTKDLKDRFRSKIRVAPLINFLPVDIIDKLNHPAMSRKIVRFIDERKKS